MDVNIVKRKRLLDDFFKVDEIHLRHQTFSGDWSETVRRLNFERGEAVAVLIYLEDTDQFVLVRQFRFAVYETGGEGWIEEVVAGILDEDAPLDCARRECIEEAGYEIGRFDYLGTYFVSPGASTERIHLYTGYCQSADRKHPGGGLDHEHEDIEVRVIPREEAFRNLRNGVYTDAKTVMCLQHFLLSKGSRD